MQCGGGQLHTSSANRTQKFVAEVQPCCWRSNSSWPGGVAGLIALVVAGVVLVDVRRQGNGAVLHQQRFEGDRIGAAGRKLQDAATRGGIAAQHLQRQRRLAFGHHLKPITGLELLGGFSQAKPLARAVMPRLEHQQLHRPATRPTRFQPGPKHPGVIHN